MPAPGLGLRIGGDPLPNSFPPLRRDRRIVDGSLMLLDFGHTDCNLGMTGLPQVGGKVTNIAARTAARLVGRTKDQLGDLDALFVRGSDAAANQLKLERTAGGRLHIMVSQANGANVFAGFDLPDVIKDYIIARTTMGNANPLGAQIAVFASYRVTRPGNGGLIGNLPMFGFANTSGQVLMNMTITTANVAYAATDTSPDALGTSTTTPANVNTLGAEVYRAAAAIGWSGSKPTRAQFGGMVAGTGAGNGFGAFGAYQRIAPSIALGHFHLVDLTVGNGGQPLTYWQMLAIDQAGTTGRYAGDTTTPTDPAGF